MKKTKQSILFCLISRKVRHSTGMFCCALALVCLMSCDSTRRTSSHRNGNNFYNTYRISQTNNRSTTIEGGARELGIFAILVAAVVVIPPVLEAIGEVIDGVFVGIGLKEK